jgi:hypothetical protein
LMTPSETVTTFAWRFGAPVITCWLVLTR